MVGRSIVANAVESRCTMAASEKDQKMTGTTIFHCESLEGAVQLTQNERGRKRSAAVPMDPGEPAQYGVPKFLFTINQ